MITLSPIDVLLLIITLGPIKQLFPILDDSWIKAELWIEGFTILSPLK